MAMFKQLFRSRHSSSMHKSPQIELKDFSNSYYSNSNSIVGIDYHADQVVQSDTFECPASLPHARNTGNRSSATSGRQPSQPIQYYELPATTVSQSNCPERPAASAYSRREASAIYAPTRSTVPSSRPDDLSHRRSHSNSNRRSQRSNGLYRSATVSEVVPDMLPPSYRNSMTPQLLSPGTVSRYHARVFCQRKSINGSVMRELPRDIREFRLARVTLIPVIAGYRQFVSIDVSFGRMDAKFAPLLQKHFLVTPETIMPAFSFPRRDNRLERCPVREISPLRVMYAEETTMLYVIFESIEADAKFIAEFASIKHLAE